MQKKDDVEKISILKGLNPDQKQAVEHTDGPNLILAGAGSGKTRVLTHKIAYLIERKKVPPSEILALTFTNKAASVMRTRIAMLIKNQSSELWCSTFHSCFARILRRDCEKLGFKPNFAIYDEDDQSSLIKLIINDLKPGHEVYPATAVRSKISMLKNQLIRPYEFNQDFSSPFDEFVGMIYPEYQSRLKACNAMDFDDLLIMPIELFDSFPLVLAYYQSRWQYILVDEYQDTNYPQYLLLKMFSQKHRNLSVVGDDDQSIYRWRGASIRNILEFERDFNECATFRLEQNYRSTQNILAVANSVIAHNYSRMVKELWTKNDHGEPVTLLQSTTGEEEASKIVSKIQEEFHKHKRNFSDFAILYRTNAQSRVLEDGLRLNGIAYIIVGGIRFYERKEIKDVLAYLRVVCNPLDEISLKRIINFPLRGIGNTTIGKISRFCTENRIPFFEGLKQIEKIDDIGEKFRYKITDFYRMIEKYYNVKDTISAIELASTLVEELGISDLYKQEGTEEAMNRLDNVSELLTQINQFSGQKNDVTLSHFLEEVSLVADIDKWDESTNAVTLMTLHSAKGLEFPVVFIAGLEEGLLPLSRNSNSLDELEEERRLFYVGATRAMEKLYMSYATQRMRFGEVMSGMKSRFIKEVKKDLVEIDESHTHYPRMTKRTPSIHHMEKTEPREKELKRGAYVRHPQFGKGIVLNLDGKGANQKAIIIFENVGEKKIIIQYAKLEIL